MKADEFDRLVSLSEKKHREELIAANEAFTAAMMTAMSSRRKGREWVNPGVVVDTTPFVARIIRADVPGSCGSPAAMRVESGGPTGDRVLR